MNKTEYIFLSNGYVGGASRFIYDHLNYLVKKNKKTILIDDNPYKTYSRIPYNVIVKQIYGKSKWLIGENKFVLEPNQTCLIPKNTGHAVIEKTENKLSLTLNIE